MVSFELYMKDGQIGFEGDRPASYSEYMAASKRGGGVFDILVPGVVVWLSDCIFTTGDDLMQGC